MKKFLILSVVVVATLFGKGEIAQGADLCGGTNGNGQIASVGNNSFTLERNDGRNLIVNLTNRATIETSTGLASPSDLKMGDRVTLVGDDNRDGTFTADAVIVCSGTQEAGNQENGTGAPIIVRNNDTNYEKVSGAINIITILLVGLIWLGIVAFLKLKKRKSFVYLLFFTIFYLYLYKVLDYTLLQFQSLLLLQHFVQDLMLRGVETGKSLNFIPLATLTLEDVKTSLLNILMMTPFGFGLPFIRNFRFRQVAIAGFLLSVAIEFLQLITGFMANTTFRVADVNDLIFNTLGVALGYILFVGFVRICRHISHNWKISGNPILRYIAERPQIDKQR
jgi:glycopeptide antibiotics resistance protein